jgi:GNAT superfamily N-acetyltransferase
VPALPESVALIAWDPVTRPELAAAFERLNREWIEAHFVIEPRDEAVFRDPVDVILRPGGAVFFVLEAGEPVGTCAMILDAEPGVYQLTKMTVTARARGNGYGDRLLAHAIGWARERGAAAVVLLTNTSLKAAGALYRKHGFRYTPFIAPPGYLRTNARMLLALGEAPAGENPSQVNNQPNAAS